MQALPIATGRASPRAESHGFTLIELMVTIAIAAILLMIGIPSMKQMIERNAVSNQVNALVGTITFARAEAIKRNTTVTICRSEDADIADPPNCTDGSNWQSGWIVFVDRASTSGFHPSQGDVLLQVQGPFSDSGGITQSTSAKLRFRNTGLLLSGMSNFQFHSASGTASQERRVCVAKSGRARLIDNSTDTCS